ncbi:MAG: bifunctional diaminohydroxyphosphoribosylaminopyrimidine deaminase/5-amino-6-(5-phosphoribosylamino)uracil reductase RibD [Chlorobiales bacterium]|nr:bifunctional diaminohydroxyphosphoribosylaminopyrimidine deaminase/5-amino-6-(5-phosphoribosylamino)uracil reductase RibD [Chlorobiales bacterium]
MSKAPVGRESEDARFLQQCLSLARRGKGRTAPNPMVGSVIVHQGKVIGKGYHKRCGDWHAEVNAINSVKDQNLLQESTIYVSLEPCSHFGKTPPCADLIIEKKIPRVVIGCKDPFEAVSGRGIEKLKAAGIEVTVGVIEKESRQFNEAFITYHTLHRPFIALKVAQTLDGKLATKTKASQWITGEAARLYAHKLRSEYSAVMVGTGTALSDNPSLTVRHVKGKNPVRVLLDRTLRVPLNASIFDASAPTLVFTSTVKRDSEKAHSLEAKGMKVFFVSEAGNSLNLEEVFKHLYQEKLLSVLVEGGADLFGSLIKTNLCDKLYSFIAPKLIGGDGLSAISSLGVEHMQDVVTLSDLKYKTVGKDILIEGYFRRV